MGQAPVGLDSSSSKSVKPKPAKPASAALLFFLFLSAPIIIGILIKYQDKLKFWKLPVPSSPGLYALEGRKLIPFKQGPPFLQFSTKAKFIYYPGGFTSYAKQDFSSIADHFMLHAHVIHMPPPCNADLTDWKSCLNEVTDPSAPFQVSQASLFKPKVYPVNDRNDMVVIDPTMPLKPGYYRIGSSYRFWVGQDQALNSLLDVTEELSKSEKWRDALFKATFALQLEEKLSSRTIRLKEIQFHSLTNGVLAALKNTDAPLAEHIIQTGLHLALDSERKVVLESLLKRDVQIARLLSIARSKVLTNQHEEAVACAKEVLKFNPQNVEMEELIKNSPRLPIAEFEDKEIESIFVSTNPTNLVTECCGGYRCSKRILGVADLDFKRVFYTPIDGYTLSSINRIGNRAALSSNQDQILILNPQNGWKEMEIKNFRGISQTTFSDDLKYIALHRNHLRFSDLIDSKIPCTQGFPVESDEDKNSYYRKTSDIYVSASVIWDLENRKPIDVIYFPKPNRDYEVHQIAFSPGGKYLMWLASKDGNHGQSISLWKIETGKMVKSMDCAGIKAVYFSSSGKECVVQGSDFVEWRDIETETTVKKIGLRKGERVHAISDSRNFVATSDDTSTIYLYNLASDAPIFSHTLPDIVKLRNVLFSPDGKYLILLTNSDKFPVTFVRLPVNFREEVIGESYKNSTDPDFSPKMNTVTPSNTVPSVKEHKTVSAIPLESAKPTLNGIWKMEASNPSGGSLRTDKLVIVLKDGKGYLDWIREEQITSKGGGFLKSVWLNPMPKSLLNKRDPYMWCIRQPLELVVVENNIYLVKGSAKHVEKSSPDFVSKSEWIEYLRSHKYLTDESNWMYHFVKDEQGNIIDQNGNGTKFFLSPTEH